ncbi:hypothetical protein RND71_041233 [Anisodus tanguticus]|uniref:non-specific serine/threonine protein kinase n=1 Tax=Anisodus tanguticus TaxID=243964 RepID=A0AAE1QUP9_9SOLA|nr:hypothetical protein RND71_041233 [Anisodus tanguticus]
MASVGLAPTSGLRESSGHNAGVDRLPEEMNDMRIRDDKEMEAAIVDGNGTETGHIIVTTIGGRNGQPKQTISYMAERVVGQGSFGVVFQAKCLETGETVAIKKVLQDKRYKNRELQTMHNDFLEVVVFSNVPEVQDAVCVWQIFRALSYVHRTIGVCHRDIKPQNLLVNPHTHQVKLCDFGSAKVLVKGEPNISYICSRYYRAPELIFGATEYTTAIDVWSAGCVLAELLLGQPLFPGESGVDQLVEIIKVLGTPTREEIKCMNPNYNEFKFPQIKAHPWHKIFHKRMPPEAVDLVSRLLQYSPNLRCAANFLKSNAMVTPSKNLFKTSGSKYPIQNFKDAMHVLFEGRVLLQILPFVGHVSVFWGSVFLILILWFGLSLDISYVFHDSRLAVLRFLVRKIFNLLDALIHPFFDELRDPNTRLPNGRFLPPLFNFKAHELKNVHAEVLLKLVPEHARKQGIANMEIPPGGVFREKAGASLGNLPPSLRPPSEGGYPPLPFVDWG